MVRGVICSESIQIMRQTNLTTYVGKEKIVREPVVHVARGPRKLQRMHKLLQCFIQKEAKFVYI